MSTTMAWIIIGLIGWLAPPLMITDKRTPYLEALVMLTAVEAMIIVISGVFFLVLWAINTVLA